MELSNILELIHAVSDSNLTEFNLQDGNLNISMSTEDNRTAGSRKRRYSILCGWLSANSTADFTGCRTESERHRQSR